MKNARPLFASLASALTFSLLTAAPPTLGAAATDSAFNQMVGTMTGRDTGSQWFDYYVDTLNQEIASRAGEEPFGAAGPTGPVSGFDAYLGRFVPPDTGSMWFNAYVDELNRQLQDRKQ